MMHTPIKREIFNFLNRSITAERNIKYSMNKKSIT